MTGTQRFLAVLGNGMVALALPTVVRACPLCASDTAREVRAGLFDDRLGFHLVASLLPFLVLLGVVAITYYGFPFERQEDRAP